MNRFEGTWIANLSKSKRHAKHLFQSVALRFEISGNAVSLRPSCVNMEGKQETGTQTLTSTSVPGIPLAAHTFATPQDMIAEVIDARVYSGFHYRTSGVHGTVIGKKVADWVSSHYFLRAK